MNPCFGNFKIGNPNSLAYPLPCGTRRPSCLMVIQCGKSKCTGTVRAIVKGVWWAHKQAEVFMREGERPAAVEGDSWPNSGIKSNIQTRQRERERECGLMNFVRIRTHRFWGTFLLFLPLALSSCTCRRPIYAHRGRPESTKTSVIKNNWYATLDIGQWDGRPLHSSFLPDFPSGGFASVPTWSISSGCGSKPILRWKHQLNALPRGIVTVFVPYCDRCRSKEGSGWCVACAEKTWSVRCKYISRTK